MATFLKVSGLTKRFGGLVASNDITFEVTEGEIFGIIGPNGAGKTTLFNVIAGHYRPTAGKVFFDDDDISGRSSDEVGRRGIARTFQAVHLFKDETVRENLRRAAVIAQRHDPFAYFFRRSPRAGGDLAQIAEFLGFTADLNKTAGGLSYGRQKVLGIGMAMMTMPRLLLMDEPAAGLNPSEKKATAQLIARLRSELGISVLIVEHDMPLVMGICDRILVVNQGKQIALGTPDTIKSDPSVIEAYLGEDYEFA